MESFSPILLTNPQGITHRAGRTRHNPKIMQHHNYMALIPQNYHRFVSSLIPSKWVGPNKINDHKKWPSYHASFFFMARFIMIVSCSSTAIPLECRHSVAMTPGRVVPGATGWAPNYYFRGFIPSYTHLQPWFFIGFTGVIFPTL